MGYNLLEIIYLIPAALIAFTVHEYAHAAVAYKLGDKTPKFQGRLTLNPLAHIDIIGFIMIFVARIGWAKPVQVNPSAFKNYYKDDLKVSFAGPLANLITAFILAIIAGLLMRITVIQSQVIEIILGVLIYTVQLNITLFFFNLIPIPGLDGFHILRDLFPKAFYNIEHVVYKYQYVILLLFILTPISRYVVGNPTRIVYNLFMNIGMLGM